MPFGIFLSILMAMSLKDNTCPRSAASIPPYLTSVLPATSRDFEASRVAPPPVSKPSSSLMAPIIILPPPMEPAPASPRTPLATRVSPSAKILLPGLFRNRVEFLPEFNCESFSF